MSTDSHVLGWRHGLWKICVFKSLLNVITVSYSVMSARGQRISGQSYTTYGKRSPDKLVW